ncbi:hypothetical protein [Chamaesiphon minutus]|uniref:Uncharacterized protein n=1 Tax=Chamaesiphon minutus (strain ATCC 27169 / PCC 6605) TaxID=1173020 RepID=K9UJV7_CHAP6|nr:hypothetical protein [Chamaesiphon minutus]AFY94484.1 hypothetical protein Cha6605_3494 [Chamaesiphon minutus PCC 6605]
MSEQLAFTVNMYQSSTRKNFLDVLADPTAIAILGSIALHAIIGTTLPFFTQPEKEGKKSGPTTVKVVQLTPNELQRIPQAPPTPVPQPPVTLPTPTTRPSVAPTTPQFSTAPQTIPFSPVRTPNTSKPPSGKKEQTAAQQKPSTSAIFDPDAVFKPTPTPTKPPTKKGNTPKKTVAQQSPPPKTQPQPKKTTAPTPQPKPATDDDGTDTSTTTPTTNPNTQTQQPPSSQQPNTSPDSTTTTLPTKSPQAGGAGNNSGSGYAQAALAKEIEYRNKYPGLVVYTPKDLQQPYPPGISCPKIRQPPLIVYMVAFDKVPDNQNSNVLGNITPDSLDAAAFANEDTPENRKLAVKAKDAAIVAANTADRDRPVADRDKKVLYQYRVRFDPATCQQ